MLARINEKGAAVAAAEDGGGDLTPQRLGHKKKPINAKAIMRSEVDACTIQRP